MSNDFFSNLYSLCFVFTCNQLYVPVSAVQHVVFADFSNLNSLFILN